MKERLSHPDFGSLALIVALALILRLWRLDDLGLWHDEALAWQRASSDLATLLRGRPIDQDPPLLALALRAWMELGGQSEGWLRLPGVVAGAASAGLAGFWLRRRSGMRAGLLVGLLFALSPAQIHYARELNQYAFIPLLTLLLVIAYENLLLNDSPRTWMLFGLVSMTALGMHYGLVFPLALFVLDLFRRARRPQPPIRMTDLRRFLMAMVAFIVFLTWLGLAERAMLSHLDPRVFGTSVFKEIDYLADRLWREVLVFQLLPFSGGPALWAVAAWSMIALWGLLPEAWRRAPGSPISNPATTRSMSGTSAETDAAAFIESKAVVSVSPTATKVETSEGRARRSLSTATLLFGPLLLSYPFDILGMYPVGNRWALFLSPFFLAALAMGLDAVWRESGAMGWSACIATSMMLLGFLPQLDAFNDLFGLPREHTREAVLSLESRFEDGDRVFVWHAAVPVFDYYALRSRAEVIRGAHPDVEPIDAMVARWLGEEDQSLEGMPGRHWVLLDRIRAEELAALTEAIEARGLSLVRTDYGNGASLSFLARPMIAVP